MLLNFELEKEAFFKDVLPISIAKFIQALQKKYFFFYSQC